MAISTNLKLGIALPVLLVAFFGGANILFFEYYRDVSFIAVEADKAALIGDIPSYITIEEFERRLKELGAPSLRVDDTQQIVGDDERPPFQHTFIDVEGFEDLGHTGNLTAHFFNDRLAEVSFDTPDINDYYEKFLEQRGLQASQAQVLALGHLQIRLAIAAGGKPFVFMEDIRLTDEMKLWIKRYS